MAALSRSESRPLLKPKSRTMDVDMADDTIQSPIQATQAKLEGKKPMLVTVDDVHPFDLEQYISAYSGRTAVYRLFHIIEHCPTLAEQAFRLVSKRIMAGNDTAFYERAVNLTKAAVGNADTNMECDEEWVENIAERNVAERNRLEAELKTYQANMIRESIRMAHRDLGDFYRATGDDGTALKHYTKSREFCSSSQHILDMCLSVLELFIEQRNYSHISTYIYKADAALDVAASSSAGPSGPAPSKQLHKKSAPTHTAERERMQTKMDISTGLACLGQANYKKAAEAFLKLRPPKALEDWNGKIITPSDVAIYGSLCALASLSRGAIKAQLIQSETFTMYLEQEPYVRELVEAYLANKFKVVLDLLERYSARHYLDIHLSSHIHDLTILIRDRALVLYFQPFTTIRLSKMGGAFGIDVDELEKLVVGLIQSGDIKGRIDSKNKILKARIVDQRAELIARAAQVGAQMEATDRKLLLRMRLQQADLVVRAPKPQTHPASMMAVDA